MVPESRLYTLRQNPHHITRQRVYVSAVLARCSTLQLVTRLVSSIKNLTRQCRVLCRLLFVLFIFVSTCIWCVYDIFWGQRSRDVCVRCTAVPCPALRAPPHAKLDLCSQPSVYGAVCTFHCDVGYQLSDRSPVLCELGDDGDTYWTPSAPRCLCKKNYTFYLPPPDPTFHPAPLHSTRSNVRHLHIYMLQT